jgi:hypothetical protein
VAPLIHFAFANRAVEAEFVCNGNVPAKEDAQTQHGVGMIETWNDLLDVAWWAMTGREDRPRLHVSLRPSRSAFAAVIWAWTSALLLLSALIFTGDVNDPVPSWVFAVIGAVALLWAPTQYAACADARRLRRFAIIALVIGAPVWILPVPPDVAFSAMHRFALWALFGIATALAAPLLAVPLRVLRPSFSPPRRAITD